MTVMPPVTPSQPSAAPWLAQLGAVVRYEFLMQWRRRSMLVMTLAAIAICALILRAFSGEMHLSNAQLLAAGAAPEDARQVLARTVQPMVVIVMLMILLLMQIVVSDVIPRDRQHRVSEVLAASPLPTAIYLIGKVLSMCLVSWVCFGGAMIAIGAMWWAFVGPYDLGIYLGLWAVIAVLVLINPGIAVLLAAGQPNRRGALIVGGLFTALCIYLMTRFEATVTFGELLSPARIVIFKYYMLASTETSPLHSLLPVTPGDVLAALAVGLCELGLVGIGAWLWLRRGVQEARA